MTGCKLTFLCAVASLLAVTGPVPAHAAPSGNTVRVESGLIDGKRLPSGVSAFLGIPYAEPPVRELRWRDPQPVPAWQGVYHADRLGPQCVQPLRDPLGNQYGGAEVTSEDCLSLNIWTRRGLKKAPVIVYLHGGAFFIGSARMPLYGGESVAREGAVFVNLNYRLGVLGFLAHPELSAESAGKTSGNYGFLDQIAALRWVQRNIARFGGDPSNVTIAGQSAGSMSVLTLQASPLAKGLFQRAVGMSGGSMGGPFSLAPLAEAEREGLKLQAFVKATNLAAMRMLPADRLLLPRVPNGPVIGPVQDGRVVVEQPAEVFARSKQNDVPLLLGFTKDETLGGLGAVTGLDDYRAKAAARYGSRADAFLSLYPASSDVEAKAQARAADRDSTMVIAMNAWATAQTRNGSAPVFTYEFARPHSYVPGVRFSDLDPINAGAYHTSEVPFWLGTLDSFNTYRPTRAWSAEDRAFSAMMLRSLVAFARTGRPDTDDLHFPKFDPANPELLELGEKAAQFPWPDSRKLEFFREQNRLVSVSGAARD